MSRKPGWSGPNRGWTREKLIEKAHEWTRLYGKPPLYGDWERTRLRKKAEALSARAQEAWEAYARYTDGDWPSFVTIQTRFGDWARYLEAAGLPLDTLIAASPAAARIQRERSADAAAVRADQVHGAQHDDHDTADDGDDQRDVREVRDQPSAGDDSGDRGERWHDRTVKAPS